MAYGETSRAPSTPTAAMAATMSWPVAEAGLDPGRRRREHSGGVGSDLEAQLCRLRTGRGRPRRAGRKDGKGWSPGGCGNRAPNLALVGGGIQEQDVGPFLNVHLDPGHR